MDIIFYKIMGLEHPKEKDMDLNLIKTFMQDEEKESLKPMIENVVPKQTYT